MNDSREKKKKKIERPEWWKILHPQGVDEAEWFADNYSPPPGFSAVTTLLEAMKHNDGFWTRILRYMTHTMHVKTWHWIDPKTLLIYVGPEVSEDVMEEIAKQVMESVIEITIRDIGRRLDMPVNLLHYVLSRLRVKVVNEWEIIGGETDIDPE